MLKKIKEKISNPNGTINGKVAVGLIAALILFGQQLIAVTGFEFKGDWSQIQGLLNTILTVLTIVGVVEMPVDDKGDKNG